MTKKLVKNLTSNSAKIMINKLLVNSKLTFERNVETNADISIRFYRP